YQQQAATAENLGENIGSRKVARGLVNVVEKIVERLGSGNLQVDALHDEARDLIKQARRLADKAEEERLVRQLEAAYERYERAWHARSGLDKTKQEDATRAALRILEAETLPICLRLQNFNAEQIDLSEAEHRQTVRRMAWGLALAGTVGS